MTRRNVGLMAVSALVATVSTFLTPTPARAVTTKMTTVTVTGGYMPAGPDPPYFYDFFVSLDGSITTGATITINDLLGVTPPNYGQGDPNILNYVTGSPAIYAPPSSEIGNSAYSFVALYNPEAIVITTVGSTAFADQASVTFTYEGPGLTTSVPTYIGEFEIETNVNYSMGPPYMPGDTITYTSSVQPNGAPPGTIVLQNLAVPEPCSAVLLLLGAAIVPALRLQQRRRRQSLSASIISG
jgi:hypothetical protein